MTNEEARNAVRAIVDDHQNLLCIVLFQDRHDDWEMRTTHHPPGKMDEETFRYIGDVVRYVPAAFATWPRLPMPAASEVFTEPQLVYAVDFLLAEYSREITAMQFGRVGPGTCMLVVNERIQTGRDLVYNDFGFFLRQYPPGGGSAGGQAASVVGTDA